MEELLKRKEEAIKNLFELEDELRTYHMDLLKKKAELYLETDFKELGYTNETMRRTYVDRECAELIDVINQSEVLINYAKRCLTLITDEIQWRILGTEE